MTVKESWDTRERDEGWIREFKNGNEGAFEKIYLAHLPPLFSFVKRRLSCDDAEAEDICQDIMMTIYQKLPEFLFKAKFTTYLYTIAVNRLRNVRRKKKSLSLDDKLPGDSETSFLDTLTGVGSPHEGTFGKQVHQLLDEALAELPEKEKEVFLLKEFEQLTFDEIAEMTGQSLRNIQYLKEKAQKRIREYFEKGGITLDEVEA